MPKPLGQLRDYRGPFGGNFCGAPNRASSTWSDTRTLNGTHSRRGRINATCQHIHKCRTTPTSHIMFQLKFPKVGKNRIGEMLFETKHFFEKSKTTNICTYSCSFKTTLRTRGLLMDDKTTKYFCSK